MRGKEGWRATKASGRLLLVAVVAVALLVAPYVGANGGWGRNLDASRVSVSSDGEQGVRGSAEPAVSDDGRYVVFRSRSPLAPDTTDDDRQLFVRDTKMGTTTLVTVNKDGDEAEDDSYEPEISGDGRYVSFESDADDLVADDTNGQDDIFVRDLESGETSCVSRETDGTEATEDSWDAEISNDGRFVVYTSDADLDAGDVNGTNNRDVYMRDMQTGETTLISKPRAGGITDKGSRDADISEDGRYVVFFSGLDLVADDTNGDPDIYLLDTQSDTYKRVVVTPDGSAPDTDKDYNLRELQISDDGRFIVFDVRSDDISDKDLNGDDRYDVFHHDLTTGATTLVSEPREGAMQWDRGSTHPTLSSDGRYVAFISGQDLIPEDTDDDQDLYIRDMVTGDLQRIREPLLGGSVAIPDDETINAEISGDGMWIGYDSWADGIVAGDTNSKRDVFVQRTTPWLPDGAVRHAGATRYDTAVAVSTSTFPRGADTVVIATGDNWPDALCGSALAGAVAGPVLLTPAAALPQTVKDEIDRLGAENVYILGGTGVVSSAVETELEGMLDGFVNRLAGMNRYETGRVVADKVTMLLGDGWDGTAIVTTGENFADAVAGAPLASGLDWPVLLANPVTGDVYMPKGIMEAVILGGTGAVPATTEAMLKATEMSNQDVTRIGGATRYETAAMTAEYGVENGLLWNGVGVATGENFPDGLTGGAAVGLQRSVLLLTPTASLAPAAAMELNDNKDDIKTVQFLGGPGAVSPAVENQVKSILGM